MTPHQKKLYETAIEKFGTESQINQAVEEMAELIQAINKHRRNPSPTTLRILAGEIADVDIMINQLKLIYKFRLDYINGVKQGQLRKLENHLNLK